MHFYSSEIQQVLGVLMATVLTLAVTWFGRHLTNREKSLADAVSIHDTIIECKNNMSRIDDWIRGIEVVATSLIEQFEGEGAVDKYNIAALKRELAQRPKINSE